MEVQALAQPFGSRTNRLIHTFSKYSQGRVHISHCQIRPAVNELGLYPSSSQIFELVSGACEVSGRTPVDHVTFGEFCLLVTELQHRYSVGTGRPIPCSYYKKARGGIRHVHRMGPSVFLGGACNPTTWRQDIAIPKLKEKGVTFFNPQVNDWSPELVEIEDYAKQDAEVLFFVIDYKTRSCSSMVESAYLAGCGRQLILVVNTFKDTCDRAKFCDEYATIKEVEHLRNCHIYLTYLVERQNIPVFKDVQVAMQCALKIILEGVKVTSLTLSDGAEPVKYGHCRIADKLLRLKEAFNSIDTQKCGHLSLRDVCLAFKVATNEQLPSFVIDGLRSSRKTTYTFEEFCLLVAEYRYTKCSVWQRFVDAFLTLPIRIVEAVSNRNIRALPGISEPCVRDMFLGGSCGQSTWRQEIAIPELRKSGISYYNPVMLEWNRRYISMESSLRDNSRLLLYVITSTCRGVLSMVEAANYIGHGCNMVLCIQHLEPGVVVEGESLSAKAIKDYNRARCYLGDIANREGVPVFVNIDEAVQCAIERVRKIQS